MNAADFQSGHDRRHNDPPSLWLAVLAGSLVVHLLLLLSGRLFLFRVNSQKSAGVAAPIELVDISPKSSNKTTRSTRSSAPRVATASTDSQRAVSSEAAPQSAAPTQPSIVQSPIPKPTPQIKPSIKPTIKSSIAAATPKPQPSSSVKPLPLTTPLPQQPTQPAPAPTTTAAPTEPLVEPTSVPPPAQSGNPLPQTKPSQPGEPTQEPGELSQPNPDLPKVEVPAKRKGTDVKADLLNIQDGNGGTTIPDKLARPIESSRLFPTLNYPAEIELNLGQTIRLKVFVDRTGKQPKVTRVLEPSRSQEYDKFVSDLIEKQWTFDPATSGGQPVESLLDISVQLSSLVR